MHYGRTLLARIRRRALIFVVGVPLAAFGVAAMLPSWPVWAVVGVAVAAVTVALNTVTSRLTASACWTCGSDLGATPAGEHGRICPRCGALNQHGNDSARA
ncbi:MAG: hypothetical protein IBJ11_10745 [Phycisphaerales bacterium]|nr:hypothetical protein [Phycisphaerales bacterium]